MDPLTSVSPGAGITVTCHWHSDFYLFLCAQDGEKPCPQTLNSNNISPCQLCSSQPGPPPILVPQRTFWTFSKCDFLKISFYWQQLFCVFHLILMSTLTSKLSISQKKLG
jgi:hypothetical protein